MVRIAGAALLAGLVATIYFSPLRELLTVENVRGFLLGIGSVWYAPPLFIAAFALSCVLLVPATVFIVAAGLIWGWQLGGLYALAGAVTGATVSFHVARFLGEDVLSRFGRVGAAIRRPLERASFSALLILRLIPLFPFAVINYGSGIAGVRARHFFFATLFGVIPSIFVVAYSADALFRGSLSPQEAFKRLLVVTLLFAALVGIPMLLKKRAARALDLEIEEP